MTSRMNPSRAAGAIQRNTATMSFSGSIQVKLPPAPLANPVRQGPSPQPQQRQAQTVDPNVVVFPEAAGPLQVAVRPLLAHRWSTADAAVAVDYIGLAPQLAFPFRGLLQQVVPGDLV